MSENRRIGEFTVDDDTWRLFIHPETTELLVEWVDGPHYYRGVRRIYLRYNKGYDTPYAQFIRPRLAGEKRGKMICIPAEVWKEVIKNEQSGRAQASG